MLTLPPQDHCTGGPCFLGSSLPHLPYLFQSPQCPQEALFLIVLVSLGAYAVKEGRNLYLYCLVIYALHLGQCLTHRKHFSSSFRINETRFSTAFRAFALAVPFLQLFAVEKSRWDFPGGAVVKNLPASTGDTGSSPGPGRSHVPRSNKARAPQLLSLCSRACEPQLLSAHAATAESRVPRAHAPQQEKPPQ